MCQLSRNFISITLLDIYRNIGNFVLSFEWDLELNIPCAFILSPPLIFKSFRKGDILANVATVVPVSMNCEQAVLASACQTLNLPI